MTFHDWLDAVDSSIEKLTYGGLTSHLDLDDWGYADAYDDGVSPGRAARRALANAGFDA